MTIPEPHTQHTRAPPRASRTVDHAAPSLPASSHFTGHAAGWHGKDQPYTTDPMEQQRWRPASPLREDEEDELFLFPTRMPRSAIRYQMNTQTPRAVTFYRTRGRTQPTQDPPSPAHPPPRRPRVHWLVYLGPTLLGEGEDLAVVTLRFKDVNGDGKPDMIVSVQDSTIIFLNENGQFRPARPGEHVNL